MMPYISRQALQDLREQFPKGTRVELVQMNDPFNTKLVPGCRSSVIGVDSIGTIHVAWDYGSGLGIAYGEDSCRKVVEE